MNGITTVSSNLESLRYCSFLIRIVTVKVENYESKPDKDILILQFALAIINIEFSKIVKYLFFWASTAFVRHCLF